MIGQLKKRKFKSKFFAYFLCNFHIQGVGKSKANTSLEDTLSNYKITVKLNLITRYLAYLAVGFNLRTLSHLCCDTCNN